MAELAKQNAILNKKEEVMEAENKAIEEELDYPLEISFKWVMIDEIFRVMRYKNQDCFVNLCKWGCR